MNNNMVTDYKDGWLTIREFDTFMDEPKRTITWWPITRETRGNLEDMGLLGKEATYQGSGVYSIRIAPYQYQTAALPQGGQTKPIAFEIEDIPAPKARKGIELRFRNGQWQKYLKSQGWVAA